jgi:hypothetical protein
MRNQTVMVAIAMLMGSFQALAADPPKAGEPAKPAAEKAAAAPAGGPPMEPPKVATENELFKKSSGTWTCAGTTKGPDGAEHKYKASWTIKPILGGHWYSIVYKRSKMGPMPAFEGNGMIGWNVADKKYNFVGFDSMGGWVDLTSTDNSVYMGDGSPMGKRGPAKFTFVAGKDKKGQESEKLFDVTLDFPGVATSQESCKK